MKEIRELAQEWDVAPEPLIQAVESAKQHRRYWESQKLIIDSAEPAECTHRLEQAHKAIKALPLRAKAHLHWRLAERIAYSPYGLDAGQILQVLVDTNWVDEILGALSEPLDSEPDDPKQQLKWFVQAWQHAGGEVSMDGRYDGDLIEFLGIAYHHLGETLTEDAIRRRLDRIRRSPLDSEG